MFDKRKIRSVILCSIATGIVAGLASLADVGLCGDWCCAPGSARVGGMIQSATAQEPTSKPAIDDDDDDTPADPPPTKTLTPEQISRIRYMELNAMRKRDLGPDHVTVKISKDTIDEFLLSMEGHEDFRGKKARRAFLKMTPPQKLDVIARYKGTDYADKVMIESDPDIFVEFRRTVLPQVIRGCATSGCHLSTNRDVPAFGFIGAKRNEQAVYTNFLLLNDLTVGSHRVIDRSKPDESLLLTYLLPRSEVAPELRHPGDVEYKPIYRARTHPRYRLIKKWIESLKHPAEDYGVHIIEPKPPILDADDSDGDDPDDGTPKGDKPAGDSQP